MGSLHPATRFNIDRDYGALGHSRRADIVMINDNLEVLNTWIGGHLAVENKKITSLIDKQLSENRYQYPKRAYNTVILPKKINFIPDMPKESEFKINVIKTELPGIMTFKETIHIKKNDDNWLNICLLYTSDAADE